MSVDSFIIDGARSPIGTKNGQMVGIRSDDLSAQVIQGLMQRNTNIPSEVIEDVVVGCAFPEGPQGMLMARSISVLAELPIESGAKVINRFCGSSMDSVHQLSQAVLAGDVDVGIAAGAGKAIIFRKGKKSKIVKEDEMLTSLIEEIKSVEKEMQKIS